MMDRPEWHDDALCAQVDPELWFPEKGSNVTAKAVRICQACTATSLGPARCGGALSECLGPDQTRHPCPEAGS